jgi:DnaK suppressor protein
MRVDKVYRSILERKRVELRESVRNRERITIEPAADEIDAMQLAVIRDQAVTELDRHSKLLREVGGALRRIDDGSYGVCEDCEEEISPKRLNAIPWARRCVSCQDALDRESLRPAA